MSADPQRQIMVAPAGTMIWSITSIDDGPRQVALLIREESRYISSLGQNPVLAVRVGVFEETRAVPIALMLRFNADMLYETWLNFHADEQSREAVDMLSTQEHLPVIWFSTKRERGISIPNRLHAVFANAAVLAERRQWSIADFEATRNAIYARHPTPASLWRALFHRDR